MSSPSLPRNRSIPDSCVIPVLGYADPRAAATWLVQAFGLVERLRIANHRVQLSHGDGALVVAQQAASTGCSMMLRVAAVDAHCARARAAGARILAEPATHAYGERQYSAADFAGHVWTFSESVADVDPADWGGEAVAPSR